MCLLVVNQNKTGITEAQFNAAHTANPDGFGIAYRNAQGTIKIYKDLRGAKPAYAAYRKIREKNSGAFLLHFRIATHGLVDLDNCHPFQVSEKLVFAHNGIINLESEDPTQSDTAAFCQILQGLPIGFLDNEASKVLIALAIGNSKLAFLDDTGKVTIINEKLGHWNAGEWYSNASYQEAPISYGGYGGFGLGKRWRYQKQSETTDNATEDFYFDRCDICQRLTDDFIDGEEGTICQECSSLEGTTWTQERSVRR